MELLQKLQNKVFNTNLFFVERPDRIDHHGASNAIICSTKQSSISNRLKVERDGNETYWIVNEFIINDCSRGESIADILHRSSKPFFLENTLFKDNRSLL